MVAFTRHLNKDFPSGTSGLSQSSVQNFSSRLYADPITSLNSTQKAYLDAMIAGGYYSWKVL